MYYESVKSKNQKKKWLRMDKGSVKSMKIKSWKKYIAVMSGIVCVVSALTGCTGTSSQSAKSLKAQEITVVSREEGSGTRGAFIDLFKVQSKNAAGKIEDDTTVEAIVTNSTQGMMTTVSGDENGIGYISLGALNSTVKTVTIDGIEPTADNVKNGTYKVSRPFNIATKGSVSEAAQDFINYIMSEQGQKIVEATGYISDGNTGPFSGRNVAGKIVVAGSSSVTPVMEKLAEGYKKLNPALTIEIQESDSTTGMTAVSEGTCDIGMASRELKDSEKSSGLTSTAIALDGIAIIINNKNPMTAMTSTQVQSIYTGQVSNWTAVEK
jgi:phosphate transport system substrate-binding protein